MRKLTMDELDRASVEQYREQRKIPLVAVLDNLRSLHNVGAIFRSADAFSLQKLYLCGYTGTPPNRDIHKSALGSTESVAWEYVSDTSLCVAALKQQGYRVLILEQTTESILLDAFAHSVAAAPEPLALVLGNEVDGVSDTVLPLADAALEIPQYGTKHSLNVSVAAGIAFYALSQALRKG